MRSVLPLLLAAACGGSSAHVAGPAGGGAPGEGKRRATQVQVFAPSDPAVERYNAPDAPPPPHERLLDAIAGLVQQTARTAGQPVPGADGRLYAAARDLAGVVPADAPVAYPLIEFALQRHGIVEPSPHLRVIWGPLDDVDAIVEQLGAVMPEILQDGPFARVGVGAVARGAGGDGAIILALQKSFIDTEPMPRALPAGGALRIRARVREPFRDPAVFVTREDGAVEQPRLQGDAAGFAVDVDCTGHRGRQQIEVTAIDATGSTVLANFPVWCGEPAPNSLRLAPSEDDAPVTSAEEAERRLLELLNRDRARHKLPPLSADAEVAAVSRAHSREMYETGVVAHVSPRTGSASDRIRAAGIRTAAVLENVARAYGVGEAQEGLMNSPGHRANILSPDVTHVGIGVVIGDEVVGRRELFVTQVFIYRAGKIDRAAAAVEIKKRMAAASKLVHDPALAELAQAQADEIGRGVSPADATAHAAAQARPLGKRFARVSTALVTLAKLSAFDPSDVLTDPSWTHYGLGLAQASHPELGDNAIQVVLVLAQAR
ncbi:MAG TPA: CAP domain-containing protein [Kofleriaceae bacterium]|nr:CAP domain-containing protein [Kofleriaceae bacterium]